jgi:hypothetical protein
MSTLDVARAIQSIAPNTEFTYQDGEITLWESDLPKPTKAQIEAKIIGLQAEVEAKATQKAALLDRLGITEDEARLLLG